MPKLKTHRGAAKRFKKTKSGKFLRASAFKRHILSSKTTKRKRALRGTTTVAGLVNLVQDSVTVDGKISGRSLANLLNLMDTTFKVSDALGTGNSLSELISDLRNDVVDLDTMVHLASRAVFSDDGELRVSVALPKNLPLLSADDTVIHSLDFKALLTASQPVI